MRRRARAVLLLTVLSLTACPEQKPPAVDECKAFAEVVDVAERALDQIAEKTPDEEATAEDLVTFARDNAKVLDGIAKKTGSVSVKRADLVDYREGIGHLAALTSKGAGDLADALEGLGKHQAGLQELEDRGNAFNDEVRELAKELEKDCPKPRCGPIHAALTALDHPLAAVIDVASAAKSARELGTRFGRVAEAADAAKAGNAELRKKMSEASEGARTTYTLFSASLEKFVSVQERVANTQRSTQEAFVRLKAELDAAEAACRAEGEGGEKGGNSGAAPSASASG